MAEDLPKLDLLIKVMKMTGAEDAVALVAIRKANTMLAAEGWDWERVLRGKVKIIQDPFNSVKAPPVHTSPPPPPTSWPTPPKPKPRPVVYSCTSCGKTTNAPGMCHACAQKGRPKAAQPQTARQRRKTGGLSIDDLII